MKKAAILAVLGAVAAGAAAVCVKLIKDRSNSEDDYTECPCGCEGCPEDECDAQEQQSDVEETAAEEAVGDEFFHEEQEEEDKPEVTIELFTEPAEQTETPCEEPAEGETPSEANEGEEKEETI